MIRKRQSIGLTLNDLGLMNQGSIVIVFLLSTCLIACGPSEDSELRRYINDVKTRPPKPIEPIPEFESVPKFTYPEEKKRRSPFKPIVIHQRKQEDIQAPNVDRPKQPLEAFPLDALKFVGVLKQGSMIWGLISQPGGLVSRVKAEDYMGKNYGQIINITDKMIKIEETIQIGGKWDKKLIMLKLHIAK